MPIYEYGCLDCGREFEELVRGEEKPACPSCGKRRLERRLSVSSAHSTSAAQQACPARDACNMGHCCGPNCGLH
jgi:putative FmdB family regulatory protein